MGNNPETRSPSHSALLSTRLYIPPARADLVSRPRLTARMNQNVQRQLTLISASAGLIEMVALKVLAE